MSRIFTVLLAIWFCNFFAANVYADDSEFEIDEGDDTTEVYLVNDLGFFQHPLFSVL